MDVLQWIKEDHEQLRSVIKELGASPVVATRKKLIDELMKIIGLHLYLESEYLYPEVSDLYTGAESFIKASAATHKTIKRCLTEYQSLTEKKAPKHELDEKLTRLTVLLENHLIEEEAHLMPKIRELIPTQDREDLGQVFLDLRDSDGIGGKGARAKRAAYN